MVGNRTQDAAGLWSTEVTFEEGGTVVVTDLLYDGDSFNDESGDIDLQSGDMVLCEVKDGVLTRWWIEGEEK
jgi:hypothetical protein